ncbi:hypothetical protein GCM10010964_38330 [Caldovatus sediminis]|uniref:Sulfotransferase family protein n=1 Tax=Caldovatus sediminis TaxID=2041189 RepID=A0A8J3EDS7_9PROT|nr:hypothetical protein [Caldovatus sediminis]GGG47295.1 hypothetical protein GCM10010964_38330 [Caldovatus sediminis]
MYFYLHIPKTGGQTVAERIGSAFPPERAYFLRGPIASEEALAALKGRYDFVEAHVRGGALRNAGDEVRVICTVREPIGQVISHYRHIRREPRMSLHRAANQLSPAAFFEHYGDILLNFQARCLAVAFFGTGLGPRVASETRWVLDKMGEALDRITWLVPTESIDEFCMLWSVEQGIHLPFEASRNRAASGDVDLQRLRDVVAGSMERLGLDFTLWSLAREAYAQWRRDVLDAPHLGLRRLANAMCPYKAGESEIRLTRGWYPRVERGDGVSEWWAGPMPASEILVTNAAGERYLEFEVAVVLGIAADQFRFFAGPERRPLRHSHGEPDASGVVLHRVVLPPGPGPHQIQVIVPRVRSPMEIIEGATDPTRRSFASQRWRLVTD